MQTPLLSQVGDMVRGQRVHVFVGGAEQSRTGEGMSMTVHTVVVVVIWRKSFQ